MTEKGLNSKMYEQLIQLNSNNRRDIHLSIKDPTLLLFKAE